MPRLTGRIAAATLLLLPTALSAQGRIVIANDEWFTSSALVNTANPAATFGNSEEFLVNIADWLGSDRDYLAFSDNPFLVNANMQAHVTSPAIGGTWTAATDAATWSNLSSYGAVFLAGEPGAAYDAGVLVDYVRSGGNVVLLGGTGEFGGAGPEAAFWSSFLEPFGLRFLSPYNNVAGVVNVSAFAGQGPFGAPLFTGVSGLYQNNGNSLEVGLAAPPPDVTTQIFYDDSQRGLYAAASVRISQVPEPSTVALLGGGLAMLGMVGLRRRRTG